MTEMINPRTKHRILCIDGGGIRGTFPAAFLTKLEENLEKPIGSYFDLIAGTSTGGIIAIALALGYRASDILGFYEEYGPKIFGKDYGILTGLCRIPRNIRWLIQPKYTSEILRDALDKIFGDACIGNAKTRLVIPTWNPKTRSVHVCKTAHHSRFENDYQLKAVEVALATSAALTYFPHHITQHNVELLDGGIWANNPIGVAITEATKVLKWDCKSLDILSVGCLEETYTISKWAGIFFSKKKMVKLFLDAQSKGVLAEAELDTDNRNRKHDHKAIYRINHTVPYDVYKIDDARIIPTLMGIGHTVGQEQSSILKPIFFDHPAKEFKPCHQLERGDSS